MGEGGPEGRRLGRDVGVRVEQRVPERRLVARRQLALDLAAGRRRREPVELVEQARHRVGAVRVELDGLVRASGAGTGSGAARAGSTSAIVCAAAPWPFEVDIFLPPMLRNSYGHVERWLALEHLAGDRVAPVARAAGGREVLAARLDGHPEQRPLGRPFEVPGQLGVAAERADPAGRAAAVRPGDEVRPALEVDLLAVPVGDDGRPDLAAVRADRGRPDATSRDAGRWPPAGRSRGPAPPGRAPAGCTDPSHRSGRCRSSSSSGRGGCRDRRTRR